MSSRFVSRTTIRQRWDDAPADPPHNGAPKLEAYVRADGKLEMSTMLDAGGWIACDTVEEDTDGW